ncbi:glycosyltransferase [Pediococcus siamensis]|uniref:glycosyltransferase n=1 Tax=Pediococcus siamensis TaxID=381829 RepID=UPI0039A2AE26
MEKRLSIIIAVNNAQEGDLSIPLSSINNQIGVDLSQIEVVLIDNGTYKLQRPETLKIFEKINLKYIRLERVLSWEAAFQAGIEAAKGKYIMFMGVDSQLNSADILQTYFYHSDQHPDADVLSGLVMVEKIREDLKADYEVGRDALTVRARWLQREFLRSFDIKFRQDFLPYAEEYFCRLLKQLASEDVQIEEVSLAKFAARNLDPKVLGKPAQAVSATWLMMMSAYFDRLQTLNQQAFLREFARFIIRFYSQLKQLPAADRDNLVQLANGIVAKNSIAWPFTQKYVNHLAMTDHNEAAPWNGEKVQFNAYLNEFVAYLNSFGLAIKPR